MSNLVIGLQFVDFDSIEVNDGEAFGLGIGFDLVIEGFDQGLIFFEFIGVCFEDILDCVFAVFGAHFGDGVFPECSWVGFVF